jgi:hypothetical protein
MKRIQKLLILVIILFASGSLVACSESGPSSDEISKAIKSNLPAFIDLNDLSIEATENIGTETEPNFKSRIVGELKFLDDTFEIVGHVGGVPIVKKLIHEGTKRKVFGYSDSKFRQGKWITNIRYEPSPLQGIGRLKSAFAKFFVANSPELAKRQDEIKVAKAEAERKRQEAIRLEKERRAELERQRIEKLKAQRKELIGIWESDSPILQKSRVIVGTG